MIRILLLLLAFVIHTSPLRADGHIASHEIGGGSYQVYVPETWDGRSDIPVLMFFHGFGQTGRTVMRNKQLLALADERTILVVAPNGQEKRWAHQGSPSRDRLRDDDAFTAAVLDDVRERWPVDSQRVWASGFSIGGSMTWHLACYSGHLFTAYLPIAGAFWRPHPASCPSGPVNLAHVHGTGDTVVPMTGRPIREIYHQGDVLRGIAFWRGKNACPDRPADVQSVADLRCEIWRGCGSGREIQLCLHPGGHKIPSGYLARALHWAEALVAEG